MVGRKGLFCSHLFMQNGQNLSTFENTFDEIWQLSLKDFLNSTF
jgi:hypothetical protein